MICESILGVEHLCYFTHHKNCAAAWPQLVLIRMITVAFVLTWGETMVNCNCIYSNKNTLEWICLDSVVLG